MRTTKGALLAIAAIAAVTAGEEATYITPHSDKPVRVKGNQTPAQMDAALRKAKAKRDRKNARRLAEAQPDAK